MKKAIPAFILGAAIGAVAAWYISKQRYEQLMAVEADSIKEAYARKYGEQNIVNPEKTEKPEPEPMNEKPSSESEVKKYAEILHKQGYTPYSSVAEAAEMLKKDDNFIVKEPYVISPDIYGEIDNYETITLTYYSGDDTLADDCDDIMHDIEHTVGDEALESFGEYEDDVVHVRNDRLKVDYEIILDSRKYSEVVGCIEE